jgi:ATP-dependent RNA helicase RhlE
MPFAALGLPAPVLKGVRAAGYTEPTPIQRKAIPIILEGRDVVGAAQTGTGKTAAFVLPILTHLIGGESRGGEPRAGEHRVGSQGHPTAGKPAHGPRKLRALILTPTRELAAQVETNARDYARFTSLEVGVVYGGVPLPPQERMLKGVGLDLLVATPGRLLDLFGRLALRLDFVEVLVLDEADRMVDMGFAPDLRRILKLLPTKRQTLMFSATMPPDLNKVAKEALIDPVRLDLAPPSRPAAGITQAVYPVPRGLKTELLDELLSRTEVRSMIVFTRTKHGADRLARQLARRNYSVEPIHGNRSQSQRERALGNLRRGRLQILVATDIASRGIDVQGITHIVNYDVPHTPEDYVHRIGRTGRMDAVGDAFTLMTPEEAKSVVDIERFLGRTIPRVMLPDFNYHMRPKEIADSVKYTDEPRRQHGGPGRSGGARPGSRGPAGPSRHSGRPASGPHVGGARPASGQHATGGQHDAGAGYGRRPKMTHGIDRRRKGRM